MSELNIAAYLLHLHPAGAFAGILADRIAGTLQAACTGVFADGLESTLLTAYEQNGSSITDTFYGRFDHICTTGAFSRISGKGITGARRAAVTGVYFFSGFQIH